MGAAVNAPCIGSERSDAAIAPVEIASTIGPVQNGRIYIELVNPPS